MAGMPIQIYPSASLIRGQLSSTQPETKRNIQNSFWLIRSLKDSVMVLDPIEQLGFAVLCRYIYHFSY